ncbi:hypothetical protein GNP94_22085 [Paenibacillus campinasensis]|uniref:Aspartyl-phosphate phosphatase Spo0E family protein n=1 Tax=Paenibacillus campinasensis TaxID=66347 RepID=A0ABW9T5V4_9BACL|nr:hypothetical protein [Paenibacillus campinasensis]MUG68664.1 hypothetical protein [Paenibacillus campinasensis]
MKDILLARDKQRRAIRRQLASLYIEFLEAESARNLGALASINREIGKLRAFLVKTDPVEQPEPTSPEKEQRPRLANVI